MGILQDPIASIDQAQAYLLSTEKATFLEAKEIACGNLCRQILEQALFILCFYSGMPRRSFLRRDRSLKTARALLEQLDKIDVTSGVNYWKLARQRSPRIAKFARRPLTLRKWGRLLNEPSHFSLMNRKVSAATLQAFISYARTLFDELDWHLITVALNEILSNRKYRAHIGNDPPYTPGLVFRAVATAYRLEREPRGSIAFRGPEQKFTVIPADAIPKGPWRSLPVLIERSKRIEIVYEMVNKNGNLINMSTFQTLLDSIAESEHQKRYVVSRLRKIGIDARVVRVSKP